jgi:dimethylargininase
MKLALTRPVSPSITGCELTYLERTPIDYTTAARQHAAYEACLERIGYRLQRLPVEPGLPDSVFIEDTALVLDEIAVITRPGAASRRPETAAVAEALAPYRRLLPMKAPATLDGGDVLRLDRTLYVGLSTRSSPQGHRQLADLIRASGYSVQGVPLTGCLHLKSAVTQVAPDALLVNPDWVDPSTFTPWRWLAVDPAEPHAANALFMGDALLFPAAFPRTAGRLQALGLPIHTVDVSELARAEGAVTCCSLILDG